jgi:Ca-activated chloride channel homolog
MSSLSTKVEFFTEWRKLVAGREQWVDVLIRVTPPEPEQGAAKRTRLNLGLVLDRSGSMGGEKMKRAREAAEYCVDQLLPADRVSVIVFDEHVEVLIPSQEAVNKQEMKSRLAEVFARGTTALHEAWVRGGIQVSEHLDPEAINRVLLITDGLANVGETNTDRIVTQAKGLSDRGVSTSTIGIGEDFNEDLLVPMAQAAGGNAWHVERAEDMGRVFAVELKGLIAQVAHTVTLGLIPSDGVKLTDMLNDFELGETGRYKLPNLQAGSPLDVVVRLKVPAERVGARRHLLDLKLGYTPQERTSAEVLRLAFEAEFDDEEAVERLPINYDVTRAVQLLMNARARREAIAHMDAGRYDLAQGSLKAARSATMALAYVAPAACSADLGEESEQLAELEGTLMQRSLDKLNRKRMVYQDYSRRHGKEPKK